MLRRGGGSRRLLTTVLFTDIVGSTERAAALGDRAWKDLVARHHAIVRHELRRFHGRERDTAGDGFFATFDAPVEAIECATSIIDRLRPLDLRIRAGIHMGEVEVVGGKVAGITVHVASRAMSQAGPGEILVTGTVREVAAGADVTFNDRGVREFKGVPGEWHVYSVEWQPRATAAAPGIDRTSEKAAPGRRLGVAGAGLAIAAALLVGGATATVLLGAPASIPSPQPDSAMAFPASGGAPTSVVRGIDTPAGIVQDGGSIWVLGVGGKLLYAVAPDGSSTTPIALPATPTGIAASDGSVWVTEQFAGDVTRVGEVTRRVEQTIAVGTGAGAIAVGEGGVWVANENAGTVTRIDPVTRTVAGDVQVGPKPVAVVAGAGAVWAADGLDGSIWRIDPTTLKASAVATTGSGATAIAFGLGRLWVTSEVGGTVTVVDASTRSLLSTIPIPESPRGIAVGSGSVWVACARGSLVRIDPTRLVTVAPANPLPGRADGVALAGEKVWVTVQR